MRRIKLCDEDRERYGGPEWLDTDAAIVWLSDLDEPTLRGIEKQVRAEFGQVLLTFLADEVFTGSMAAFRGRAWLALLHEGVDIALADFTPKPMKMAWEPAAPDAVPPSGGADSSPSPDETAAAPSPTPSRTSRRSTAASTRGSGKRTR